MLLLAEEIVIAEYALYKRFLIYPELIKLHVWGSVVFIPSVKKYKQRSHFKNIQLCCLFRITSVCCLCTSTLGAMNFQAVLLETWLERRS